MSGISNESVASYSAYKLAAMRNYHAWHRYRWSRARMDGEPMKDSCSRHGSFCMKKYTYEPSKKIGDNLFKKRWDKIRQESVDVNTGPCFWKENHGTKYSLYFYLVPRYSCVRAQRKIKLQQNRTTFKPYANWWLCSTEQSFKFRATNTL